MNQKDKFNGFDLTNNPYEAEARQLWGDKIINQSNTHIASLSENEQNTITKDMEDLFVKLAKIRHKNPNSETVQKAIAEMYIHFNSNFGYKYTLEAFAGLGEMYISDERFTKNIDKYGNGLSEFLAKSMTIYVENQKSK